MKKLLLILLSAVLVFCCSSSQAEKKKDPNYLGAMRVVNCKEYVSLREKPDARSDKVNQVELGEIVYNCRWADKGFIYAEYQDESGYIMGKYLELAPEYEVGESTSENRLMTYEEILGGGEIVLDWREFNVRIIAAYEKETSGQESTEMLRAGCFVDDTPVWGYSVQIENGGQLSVLKAFMGGTEDEPALMIYNGAVGLTMLELMSGRELWTLPVTVCSLGNAAAVAVGDDGIIYAAGTDGPSPVAISAKGKVLWKSEISDPDVYHPYEITLGVDEIQVKYESGMEDGYQLVTIVYNGDVVGIKKITGDSSSSI